MNGILWRSTSLGVQFAKAMHYKGGSAVVEWTANASKAILVDQARANAVITKAARDAGKATWEAGAYGFTPLTGTTDAS